MTDYVCMEPVTHKKTGNKYYILHEALDCTNSRADTPVYIYCNLKGQLFVREKHEFWEKFERV